MKALSLRQPWAWAVTHGHKSIENRRWPTSFRGRFLIHAAKGMTRREYEDAREFCESAWSTIGCDCSFPGHDSLDDVRGGFVGVATLHGLVAPKLVADGRLVPNAYGDHYAGWHMPEQWGFLLRDVRPFSSLVPWIGTLGFFDVPIESCEPLRVLRDAGDLA